MLSELVQRLATQHGGRVVKSLGDGAMMHASSPAVGLAMAMAAVELAEAVGLWPLHAGVHSGPMVRREGDFFGSAVNVAARVAGEANSGEVLVTDRIVAALEGTMYRFVPLGERTLRHVHDPVALFRSERLAD
jgi:class 3 adenylate cyclase